MYSIIQTHSKLVHINNMYFITMTGISYK